MNSALSAKEKNWREDIQRAQAGDRSARDELVTQNMGLVYMVVKRFANRGAEPEELSQIGAIGLIKAIDKFDASTPYSFSTYAVPLIIGEIRRFLRDDGMIHISRAIKENARKIAIVREEAKKTDNREPSMEELCKRTGLSREELVIAMDAEAKVESIHRPLGGENDAGQTLEDRLEDSHYFETPILNRIALKQVMEDLEEQETKLIQLRFEQNHTQAEVAELMGTNQVAVSRMEKKILQKLRRRLV